MAAIFVQVVAHCPWTVLLKCNRLGLSVRVVEEFIMSRQSRAVITKLMKCKSSTEKECVKCNRKISHTS